MSATKIPLGGRSHKLDRQSMFRARLTDRDTYATTLLVMLLDQYGMEALGWTADTIRLEFLADFTVVIHPTCLDKLMSAIMILSTDEFYQNLPRFIQLCNALSADVGFDPFVFDPADSLEMAWAITEAYLIAPPDSDDAFSEEIRHYIGWQLREEGILDPPDVLQLAIQDQPKFDPLAIQSRDPEAYATIYEMQQARSDELKGVIRRQLQELFAELQALPLHQGDTQDILKKLRKSL